MIKANEKMFNEFWLFAFNRQSVFYNKLNGIMPYSTDEILTTYKFCNTYRVLDRVSQFLIREVINKSEGLTEEDIIFRVVFFKIFNLPSTWTILENEFGKMSLSNFNFDKLSHFLSELKIKQPIYNSAYISCATKYFGYESKHDNHLALLKKMFFEDHLAEKLLKIKNMEQAFKIMVSYPLIGNFMAYQLITDLAYCEFIPWREDEFTVAGPGAQRGIKKCFVEFDNYEDVIKYAFKNQEQYFLSLRLKFPYLANRKLQLIDIQNLFCEFDKYCRVAYPQIKSNRKKIKFKYSENKNKIEYCLPKKWQAKIS
ncbi:MAG: nucleotide kinase domain-containing protein [Spirochaetales bacterium]